MVHPLILPSDYPGATTCAVELTLLTGGKAAFIACYLSQPTLVHAQKCKALAGLTTGLPHHVLILGGDLQSTWGGTSPKSIHISSLPYKRWNGPIYDTYIPTAGLIVLHQPSHYLGSPTYSPLGG